MKATELCSVSVCSGREQGATTGIEIHRCSGVQRNLDFRARLAQGITENLGMM